MSGKDDIAVLIDRLNAMSPADKDALQADVLGKSPAVWVPNPGPQTNAYFSKADELFYGGQAGGGKSDLGLGLALTDHTASLVLRRFGDDALALAERAVAILDSRDGFSSQPIKIRLGKGRQIDFGGVKEEADKERYKGKPHDLIFFDEVADFLESQYEFIIAWNRSVDPNQRCRVIAAGNPPTQAEGLWVIYRWGPWLLPNHPKPARNGELRWYTTGEDGKEAEVDGPGPHLIKGENVIARSRTFIRAKLSDNPDLAATNYDAVLAKLPVGLRDAYREGRFDLGLKDRHQQVIPSDWVKAAQDRWTPTRPAGHEMSVIGADVAQGGEDKTVIGRRYLGWYAPFISVPGRSTPDGPSIVGLVMTYRRNNCTIVLDMGGGYGGSAYDHMKANGLRPYAYKGAAKSTRRTADRQLKFTNKRSEVYWRFREALDPSQQDGSPVALPNDPELVADLTAPEFEITAQGIKITPKKELIKKLGRSPDKGDCCVMTWHKGLVERPAEWRPDQSRDILRNGVTVNLGERRKPRKRR